MRAGAHDCLTDVAGLRVGHAELDGPGALSGTTVVLAPDGGAVAGADVRGAAPGTRETDLLDPRTTVQKVHAVVFSGGSAYGLDAASGVMARLGRDGHGFAVPGGVVPIVPAAVLFDLGRGGDFAARPGAALGEAAYDAARGPAGAGPVRRGVVGAGTGAVVGGLKGGIGTASAVTDAGHTVSALVVVNAVGSATDPATGELLGARFGLPGEFDDLPVPAPGAVDALRDAAASHGGRLAAGTATSLLLVATDATLDKAGCARMATMAHDGLARAIRPVHTVMDGDAAFAVATGTGSVPDLAATFALHAAAADVTSRALVDAVLAAEPAGRWPSYRSLVG